jgi:co-chaperonin GroES (HSP10)
MKFKPIGKRVLVEVVKPAEGLIAIPDSCQDYGSDGIVLAVGDGNEDVKPGDRVIVERNYNTLFKVEDRLCWLLNQQDIVAVVTKF